MYIKNTETNLSPNSELEDFEVQNTGITWHVMSDSRAVKFIDKINGESKLYWCKPAKSVYDYKLNKLISLDRKSDNIFYNVEIHDTLNDDADSVKMMGAKMGLYGLRVNKSDLTVYDKTSVLIAFKIATEDEIKKSIITALNDFIRHANDRCTCESIINIGKLRVVTTLGNSRYGTRLYSKSDRPMDKILSKVFKANILCNTVCIKSTVLKKLVIVPLNRQFILNMINSGYKVKDSKTNENLVIGNDSPYSAINGNNSEHIETFILPAIILNNFGDVEKVEYNGNKMKIHINNKNEHVVEEIET